MAENFGMMEGAYFVGRKEILDWLNNLCQTNLTKIEQTASGAIACMILDSIHPGKVTMTKVNWSAKHDYEFIDNYKVLQQALDKLKIDKHIDVDKLVRAKYQDNLEFMQWFKRFHELNHGGQSYDAVAQRMKGKGGGSYQFHSAGGAPSPATATTPGSASARTAARKPSLNKKAPPAKDVSSKTASSKSVASLSKSPRPTAPAAAAANESALQNTITQLHGQVEELNSMNAELKLTVEGLEKERDFYFGKLRDVEILLQSLPEEQQKEGVIEKIFKILYATEDEFIAPGETPVDPAA